MGLISFSELPGELAFETYDPKGFTAIVRRLDKHIGKTNDRLLSVFVAVEQYDFHDIEWHEVPGVLVSVIQPDEQLEKSWSRVHECMKQLHKPTLRRVK